jgi:8-oxo-dGTP pyrophosphatase MutT (NUDIX family)
MTVVAKAFIFDANDNVLLLRRSKTHPSHAFHHDLPGGEVEEGEDALTATVREILEEAGLEVAPELLELKRESTSPEGYRHVLFVTRLSASKPPVVISWEHDQSEWLPVHEVLARGLPSNVDSYYAMAVKYLQENHS